MTTGPGPRGANMRSLRFRSGYVTVWWIIVASARWKASLEPKSMWLMKSARVHSFSSFRLCFTSTYRGKLVPRSVDFMYVEHLAKQAIAAQGQIAFFSINIQRTQRLSHDEAQPQCSASNGNICFWPRSLKNHIYTWTTVFWVSFKSHGWLLAFGGRFILDDIRHLYAPMSRLQISRGGLKMVDAVKRLWL